MANPPAISIITVCRNAAQQLEGCLDSVQCQTLEAREHIVIDGGSEDGTQALLQQREDPRLTWISEGDAGIADAMNKGLARSRGEWTLFLQADDRLLGPDSLQSAASAVHDAADLLLFDTVTQHADGHRRLWPARPSRWRRKMPASHQGMLFRVSSVRKLGGYDTSYCICMDYDLVYRMLQSGMKAKAMPQSLASIALEGISGRRDWPSQRKRFAEEKRVHFSNTAHPAQRIAYRLYWLGYLPYRWLVNRCTRS